MKSEWPIPGSSESTRTKLYFVNLLLGFNEENEPTEGL